MVDYIHEFKAGDILSCTFRIYIKHFKILFLTYIVPVAPVLLITTYVGNLAPMGVWKWLATTLIDTTVHIIAVAPVTVVLSDICLGNEPSLQRSYRRVLDVIGRLIIVGLIINIASLIGYLLFIIPGVFISSVLMFCMTVVILEKRSVLETIKRSKSLGKGFYWRNIGIFIMTTMTWVTILLLLIIVSVIPITFISPNLATSQFMEHLGLVIGLFFAPLSFIPIILLYYDMRVRKENYDSVALTQDMMR